MKEINEKVKEIKDKLDTYAANIVFINRVSYKNNLQIEDLKSIEIHMKENKELLMELINDNFQELNKLNMEFIKNRIAKIKQNIDVKQ